MQVLHPFEGDLPTALQGDVLVTLQLGRLVLLVSAADQRQIASSRDLTADMGDLGDLVTLGLLAAPTAFFFLSYSE